MRCVSQNPVNRIETSCTTNPQQIEGRDVTSAGWQVTLCGPIPVSSRSGEASCELLYSLLNVVRGSQLIDL